MAKTHKRRSWLLISQPCDADQLDASTMQIVACWAEACSIDDAYRSAQPHVDAWLKHTPRCKISLLCGEITSQHFGVIPSTI